MRIAGVALLLLVSCTTNVRQTCDNDVQALRQMLQESPETLARSDAARGDLLFLMHGGIGAGVPGVHDQKCATIDGRFKWMRGASADAICGGGVHMELYSRSAAYAEKYNHTMAKERKSRGLPDCAF
jgi:hypothetical protein